MPELSKEDLEAMVAQSMQAIEFGDAQQRIQGERVGKLATYALSLMPIQCGLCGGFYMMPNLHPDAGKPEKLLEVGASRECVPCNQKALHGWAAKALTTATQVMDLQKRLAAAEERERGLRASLADFLHGDAWGNHEISCTIDRDAVSKCTCMLLPLLDGVRHEEMP